MKKPYFLIFYRNNYCVKNNENFLLFSYTEFRSNSQVFYEFDLNYRNQFL
jgi:hypothetical protein